MTSGKFLGVVGKERVLRMLDMNDLSAVGDTYTAFCFAKSTVRTTVNVYMY